MSLSWNEIKTRAAAFVLEWKDSQTVKEKAEAQTFEAEFLKIFGVERKRVALFEKEVRFGEGERSTLYDPVAMPPALTKAHQKLDKAVEAAYGRTFTGDTASGWRICLNCTKS